MRAGHIVVETSLPSTSSYYSTVLSVTPIAVPPSERAEFRITGFNLSRPSTRLLCALRGSYLVLEASNQRVNSITESGELQCLNFHVLSLQSLEEDSLK